MSQLHTRWVSRRERDLWCIDFSGYEHDMVGLQREIDAAEVCSVQLSRQLAARGNQPIRHPDNSPDRQLLQPEHSQSAIHKFAIVGMSGPRRFWCERIQHVTWPTPNRFFDDYEQAKDWLVGESY